MDNNITNLNQKIIEEILSTTKSDQQKIIKNSTTHQIITNGIPVHTKVRLLTDEKLTEAKKIFQEMLDNGVIRQSSSNWSSPLLMKRKKDNTWRCCGDYRRLNAITIKDEYRVPLIKDVTTRLKDARYFTKLDLEKAYHQIPMAVEDIPKTAIITPFGLFEFVMMPFGLKNAASTFQRYMDNIFRGVDFIVVYLDDILIGSENIVEHKTHLATTLQILKTNGLNLNIKKCEFNKTQINFLGHTIENNTIYPIKEKMEAINSIPPPKNVQEIRRFCGMVNFYHKFIPNCSAILTQLTEMIKNKKKLEMI